MCVCVVLSAGAIEFTNCIFAAEEDSHSECPRYENMVSDDGAPVMLELLGIWSTPFPSLPDPIQARSRCTW